MLLKFHGHCKYPSSHIPLLFSCPEATAVYSHNWEQRFLAPMQSSTHPEKYFLTINKKKIMFFFFKLSQSEYGMHLYNPPRAGGYYWNKFYFFGEVEDNSEEKKCLNVRQKLGTRNFFQCFLTLCEIFMALNSQANKIGSFSLPPLLQNPHDWFFSFIFFSRGWLISPLQIESG